jgi:hypothetical protein
MFVTTAEFLPENRTHRAGVSLSSMSGTVSRPSPFAAGADGR